MLYHENLQEVWLSVIAYLPRLPAVLLILFITPFLVRFLMKVLEKTLPIIKAKPSIVSLVSSFVGFFTWTFALTAVLQLLGFPQLAIVVGGSLALIAMSIASAASGLINDIIAGLLLAADPDVNVGETIEASGISGVVESVDITRTRVRAKSGELHIIPNRSLHSGNIVVRKPM